jgi:hypothetical protein
MTEHDVVPVLASELAALRRDAGRYRWWRQFWVSDCPTMGSLTDAETVEDVDAAIDAAMQANK